MGKTLKFSAVNPLEKNFKISVVKLLKYLKKKSQNFLQHEILELKVEKLQQLLDLKDAKIASLEQRLNQLWYIFF